jgi:hypothetical protein
MRIAFLAAAWIAIAAYAAAGEESTYLLVERTDRLRVMDRYQQSVLPSEKGLLPPFVPFRVVTRNDLLGDGFTPCMTVEAGGVRYYLLVERPGVPLGDLGARREITNAIPLGDTVRILTRQSLPFVTPLGRSVGTLGRGDVFVRAFRRGGETYGHILSHPGTFGWVRLPAMESSHVWKIVRATLPGGTGVTPRIVAEVRNRIKETNDVYSRLYVHFNAGGGYYHAPPYWELLLRSNWMECVLRNPPNADMRESTGALAQLCETALLGSGMQVASSPGSIVIRRP